LRRSDDERLSGRPELDLSHLFFGHAILGAHFTISGQPGHPTVTCRVVEAPHDEDLKTTQSSLSDLEPIGPSLALSFESNHSLSPTHIPLSPTGAVSWETRRRFTTVSATEDVPPANFLRPESSDMMRLATLWDNTVLTPDEQRVVDALRIIEPSIERIAFLGEERRAIRSVFLKLRDSDLRLPLGSVGDGLKRLLALSLNLMQARGGYLFVDEIDTGLHYGYG